MNASTQKNAISSSVSSSPVYFSSPTHSVFLALQQQQQQQRRKKARFQKNLRKPPSFDTYLLRRSNSTSSTSSCESLSSTLSLQIPTEDMVNPYYSASTVSSPVATTASPVTAAATTATATNTTPSLIRRVSSAMRFAGIFDVDDGSSIAGSSCSNSADDWDPREDEEEEEEEFFIMSSSSRCGQYHRQRNPSISSAY